MNNGARFVSITGDDWRRALAKSRARRLGAKQRIYQAILTHKNTMEHTQEQVDVALVVADEFIRTHAGGQYPHNITILAAEVRRLRETLAIRDATIRDDCGTESRAREIAKRVLPAETVDGDSYGVPTHADVMDRLASLVADLRAELAESRALGYMKRGDVEIYAHSDLCDAFEKGIKRGRAAA